MTKDGCSKWTGCLTTGLLLATNIVSFGKWRIRIYQPDATILKLRILLGLEARHIVRRWREPPECGKYSDSGLKGRDNRRCAGPSGLRFLILVYRWLTPPALDMSALRACHAQLQNGTTGPRVKTPRWRPELVSMYSIVLIAIWLSHNSRADEKTGVTVVDEIFLADPADPTRTTRVEYALKIEGKLLTPSPNGPSEWNLNSSGKFVFDQRRFLFDATGPLALRAIRRFATAETESIVGKDHKTSVVLPAQTHLIQVYGGEHQLLQLSPDVRLTRPQVDLLQFPCDPIVVTGLLPARNLKDKHEKWNTDSWVMPMLVGVDAAVSQTATCQLQSLTASDAVVTFEGTTEGAVTGSATKVTLKGELTFDRAGQFIRSFNAVQSEKREPGPFSPGLNVEATITWTQTTPQSTSSIPETMPDSAPDARQLLLTLATPGRVLMLHNRDWHVFHETAEMTMLRMVHDGALVAQCNISPSPAVPAGDFTSEQEYVAEVQAALEERKGTVKSSKIHDDVNGWRIHHVRALGKASDKALIWDYFLCTAKSGQQISLIFSYAAEDEKQVSGSPEQMLGTLTVRANRPKVALPR